MPKRLADSHAQKPSAHGAEASANNSPLSKQYLALLGSGIRIGFLIRLMPPLPKSSKNTSRLLAKFDWVRLTARGSFSNRAQCYISLVFPDSLRLLDNSTTACEVRKLSLIYRESGSLTSVALMPDGVPARFVRGSAA